MILDYIKHLYIKITGKRIDYNKYLSSKHWKRTRAKALKRAKYKCQLCGRKKCTFNVHHNNYKNLYWEDKSDLIVLCTRCHTMFHSYIRRRGKDVK